MEYIENVNVAQIMQQQQNYKTEKDALELRLSQLQNEVESTKRGIHSYDGAIQACSALLQTAESKEVEITELEEK